MAEAATGVIVSELWYFYNFSAIITICLGTGAA